MAAHLEHAACDTSVEKMFVRAARWFTVELDFFSPDLEREGSVVSGLVRVNLARLERAVTSQSISELP